MMIDEKIKLGKNTTIGGTVVSIFPEYMKVPDVVVTSIGVYLFKSGYMISNAIPL
jgi:hypothetical protein